MRGTWHGVARHHEMVNVLGCQGIWRRYVEDGAAWEKPSPAGLEDCRLSRQPTCTAAQRATSPLVPSCAQIPKSAAARASHPPSPQPACMPACLRTPYCPLAHLFCPTWLREYPPPPGPRPPPTDLHICCTSLLLCTSLLTHTAPPRAPPAAPRPPAADLQAGATPSYIFGCARQPGGTLVAAACCDGVLRFWSLRPTGHLEWAGQVGWRALVALRHDNKARHAAQLRLS